MKLTRLAKEPILKPLDHHRWEKGAVFNPGAVFHNGSFHLIYRATDMGPHERFGPYTNSLGYAVSMDLVNWERSDNPILEPRAPQEARGPEDPRIVELDGLFYMVYCGFGGRFDGDYRLSMATSEDLVHWERRGVMLDEENKNGALFPERIDGRYCLLHRRHPDIWLCFSDDLKTWEHHRKIMSPQPGTWNHKKIGIAGPPIKLEGRWLLLFHGVDSQWTYRLGAALLDYEDPGRVVARQAEPILEPELEWERNGFVPQVVFSCGTVRKDDRIYCFYGGADTVIGVACVDSQEVTFDDESWLV
ncbi:MAG: glycosidase [Fidelibacterota bacterium]